MYFDLISLFWPKQKTLLILGSNIFCISTPPVRAKWKYWTSTCSLQVPFTGHFLGSHFPASVEMLKDSGPGTPVPSECTAGHTIGGGGAQARAQDTQRGGCDWQHLPTSPRCRSEMAHSYTTQSTYTAYSEGNGGDSLHIKNHHCYLSPFKKPSKKGRVKGKPNREKLAFWVALGLRPQGL